MTRAADVTSSPALREALLLLAVSLLLAIGGWLARTPRLPLRADMQTYRLELGFPVVAPAAALALYRAGDHLFLDTREVDPARAARIPGSLAVRAASFADDLLAVHEFLGPRDKVVLCGDGNLLVSAAIGARLRERGYTDISLLQGDLATWRRAGGPVTGGEDGR
jgi:rhodanese-related sulfurtransferase